MDDYEFSEVRDPSWKKRPKGLVWNILSILVLVITFCIALAFLLIYLNPNSFLNPFPPPTQNPTATATIGLRFTLVPSWTPTNVSTLIPPTAKPLPTHTPLVTPTPVETSTTVAPIVAAATNDYAFVLQPGSPAAIDGSTFHPDAECKWLGVAGQATSLNGESVKGLFVQLGGDLPGVERLDNITMTGLAPQYGQGGFEITLADQLIASSGTLWIQLLDQQNLPLSDRIYFDTYPDCTKNLIIIYFDQVR